MYKRISERRQHLLATSPSMEHYLDIIAELLSQGQVCSVSDIAARAQVSRPAVSRAVRELAGQGLVEHKSYGYVVLTPDGVALARRLSARRKALHRFLTSVLRYEDSVAGEQAHRLEHLLDDEFAARLAQLTVFLESDHATGERWQERIDRHLDTVH